jgi:hypothetical protein
MPPLERGGSLSSSGEVPTREQRRTQPALLMAAASLAEIFHSIDVSPGLQWASPFVARRSLMLRTADVMGTLTVSSSSSGAFASPELPRRVEGREPPLRLLERLVAAADPMPEMEDEEEAESDFKVRTCSA